MTSTSTNRPDQPNVLLTPELLGELRRIPLLSSVPDAALQQFDSFQLVEFAMGETIAHEGDGAEFFWILLSGEVDALETQPDGSQIPAYTYHAGSAFGEVALLANLPNTHTFRTAKPVRLLRLKETSFWRLMTDSPEVRRAILRNMAMRVQKMQHHAVQQEKMATLGTLAAGLMHELNNPGAAARRASAQLRANFSRMQELSARFSHRQMTAEQMTCMDQLKQQALSATGAAHLNSIEQSDAEEELAAWMESAEIPDAWKLAPALASVGLTSADMECARHAFTTEIFSDTVAWVEAMVSNVQLVSTIEESIGRISDLVRAVKTYAYEGSSQSHTISLNESIQATVLILGHKLREKQIHFDHDLAADLPPLHCVCKGLNQIWTNLLDNAIDAVPQGGRISVKTWSETHANTSDLCILIADNGSGIPFELQPHIFDPFFTTKAPGVGTGLGLGIVGRIVDQSHGTVRFTSTPGRTEFLIRLPADPAGSLQH